LAIDFESNEQFAIKIINYSSSDNEAKFMTILDHVNILNIIE